MVQHLLLGDVKSQQKEGNEILGNNLGKMTYRGRREMKEYEVTSKENTELIEYKEAEQVLYHHHSWFERQSGEARTVAIVNNLPAPAHGMQN